MLSPRAGSGRSIRLAPGTAALALALSALALCPTSAQAQSEPWTTIHASMQAWMGRAEVSCQPDQDMNLICAFIRCLGGAIELGLMSTTPDAAEDGDPWILQFDSSFSYRQPFAVEERDGWSLYATPLDESQRDLFASSGVILLTPLAEWQRVAMLKSGDWPDLKTQVFGLAGSTGALERVARNCGL